MSRSEFVEYVKDLNIEDLEVMVELVLSYFDDYNDLPEDKEDERQLAWEKYVILISKYGITFAEYTKMMIDLRKQLENAKAEKEVDD